MIKNNIEQAKNWLAIAVSLIAVVSAVAVLIGNHFLQIDKVKNSVSVETFNSTMAQNDREHSQITSMVAEIKTTVKELTSEVKKTNENVSNISGKIDMLLTR